jgi:hypothetical protein
MGHLIKRSKGGHQTGRTHVTVDKRRRAMPPGKRRSASGRTYTENRRSRSDRSQKRRL